MSKKSGLYLVQTPAGFQGFYNTRAVYSGREGKVAWGHAHALRLQGKVARVLHYEALTASGTLVEAEPLDEERGEKR